MKKILITGGAGFIGYHLAYRLSENNDNFITIVDNLHRGRMDTYMKQLISKQNVRFFEIDLTDIDLMRKNIWEHYDEIYHLAAIIGVKHCMQHPDMVLRVNFLSTMNIVDLAKENKVGKIVFASTCETYAGGFKYGIINVPTDENVPLLVSDINNPRWTYASSKMTNEQMIIFNSPNSYRYSIVRYHNIYGQREGFAHVIPEILVRIIDGERPLRVYGADQTRSFCHVYDGVSQTISVMESENTDNEIINIGEESEISIKDLVCQILKTLDIKCEIKEMDPPVGSVDRRCPDTTKLKKLTNYKSTVSFEEGIKMTIEWYRKEIEKGNIWE
jgi:UDP-glucose 4-epimerase